MNKGTYIWKKMVGVILMAALAMEGLTSCGMSAAKREEKAQEILEKKYGEVFTITEVYSQKLGENYFQVQAYPAENPQLRFTASVDLEADGVSDTYVERLVCAQISELVSQNLDSLPGYCDIFTHAVGPQPISEDADISVLDYFALDELNKFRIYMHFCPENADVEIIYGCLENIMKGMEFLRGDIQLCIVDESQLEEIQAYFETNDDINYEYEVLMGDKFVLEIPYEKGKLLMKKDVFYTAMRDVL